MSEDKNYINEEIKTCDDACDIEGLSEEPVIHWNEKEDDRAAWEGYIPPDVSEVAPEEPLAHGYPKNKLFGYDKIDEIHVKCPKYDATYVLNPDDPELICPVCGDFHELKDYMIWYKDGSSCTAKTAAR